jgi:hypothetical protein
MQAACGKVARRKAGTRIAANARERRQAAIDLYKRVTIDVNPAIGRLTSTLNSNSFHHVLGCQFAMSVTNLGPFWFFGQPDNPLEAGWAG